MVLKSKFCSDGIWCRTHLHHRDFNDSTNIKSPFSHVRVVIVKIGRKGEKVGSEVFCKRNITYTLQPDFTLPYYEFNYYFKLDIKHSTHFVIDEKLGENDKNFKRKMTTILIFPSGLYTLQCVSSL